MKTGSAAKTPARTDLERFQKAAEAFTKKATASEKTARETLESLGIIQKNGKLSTNYR